MNSSPTFRGPAGATVQVLASARANGVLVNRTKLAKLLYLADLRAVDVGWPPGSDVEWRWRNYGPYSDTLQDIERDLCAAGIIETSEKPTTYGTAETRMRLIDNPVVDIDDGFARIVEQVIVEFGSYSAGQLRELTYQTPPMRAAVHAGKREVRLDLAGGEPYPDLTRTQNRLRRLARDFPLSESDDPDGIVELREEINSTRAIRDQANSELFGDQ